jgi:hypothetical protein
MVKALTANDHIEFLKAHATQSENCLRPDSPAFWKVKTPIVAFKAVMIPSEADSYNFEMIKALPRPKSKQEKDVFRDTVDKIIRLTPCEKRGIANIIIPAGAEIYYGAHGEHSVHFGKVRASKAILHSISRQSNGDYVGFGRSSHDMSYLYKTSTCQADPIKAIILKPTESFSKKWDTCESGIHFFLDLQLAKDYC